MNDGYSLENFMKIPPGSKFIRLKRPVVVEGNPGVQVGDVFEVPNGVALTLINQGAAEEAEAAAVASAPEVVETREPEVQAREPQIKRGRPAKEKPHQQPS